VARGKDLVLKLDLDRIDHWRKLGAQQSERVRALVAGYRKNLGAQPVERRRPSLSRYLVLGRIVAAHGVRGAVRARSYAEQPQSLSQHRQWLLRGTDGVQQCFEVLQAQWMDVDCARCSAA